MNKKANTNYRDTSDKTIDLINARLNNKFTEEDFYKVIDKKCDTWLQEKTMCKYLRPETLFGTKFESYLNEKVIKVEEKKKEEMSEAMKQFLAEGDEANE